MANQPHRESAEQRRRGGGDDHVADPERVAFDERVEGKRPGGQQCQRNEPGAVGRAPHSSDQQPRRCRQRDALERARQLLTSLKAYLVAQEIDPSKSGPLPEKSPDDVQKTVAPWWGANVQGTIEG